MRISYPTPNISKDNDIFAIKVQGPSRDAFGQSLSPLPSHLPF